MSVAGSEAEFELITFFKQADTLSRKKLELWRAHTPRALHPACSRVQNPSIV